MQWSVYFSCMIMGDLLLSALNDFLVKTNKDINVTKKQYISATTKISDEE